MKNYKKILILLSLLLVLIFFHISIITKERTIANGTLVLLELAPVDPRSLMQGDYMNLDYALGREVNTDSLPKRGYCVVRLDSGLVATRVRFQTGREPLKPGEYLINYTSNGWRVNIGAQSFFFQEGQANKYDSARYGALKIDKEGHSLLVGLYDAAQRPIR